MPVTASIGAATWRVGESLEALVDRADRAMYASKSEGRNRVTQSLQDANGVRVESRMNDTHIQGEGVRAGRGDEKS